MAKLTKLEAFVQVASDLNKTKLKQLEKVKTYMISAVRGRKFKTNKYLFSISFNLCDMSSSFSLAFSACYQP